MQIRLIVAHPDYNHSAHFEMKSENADAGEGREGGVWSHVTRYARDHCPQDPDIELIIHTTQRIKELFMLRRHDTPRSKIASHVKTWMVRCSQLHIMCSGHRRALLLCCRLMRPCDGCCKRRQRGRLGFICGARCPRLRVTQWRYTLAAGSSRQAFQDAGLMRTQPLQRSCDHVARVAVVAQMHAIARACLEQGMSARAARLRRSRVRDHVPARVHSNLQVLVLGDVLHWPMHTAVRRARWFSRAFKQTR